MSLATLLSGVVSLFNKIFEYIASSRLIDAGRRQEREEATLRNAQDVTKAAEIDSLPAVSDRRELLRRLLARSPDS